MSIDIKAIISQIPAQAKTVADSVGSTSIDCAKTAGQFISSHTPENIKEGIKGIKIPQAVDTFISSAKEKTPEFVKTAGNFVKDNKKTFVGGAVILAAVVCATSIIKAVVDKIKQAKADADTKYVSEMYQG